MSHYEEKPVHYGFIFSAAIVMFLVSWAGVNLLLLVTKGDSSHPTLVHEKNKTTQNVLEQASHQQPTIPALVQLRELNVHSKRNLAQYYSRRAYSGAPPIIPHDVEEHAGKPDTSCLTCHEKGGYVAKFGAYSPITPHPTYHNCRQCHIPQKAKNLFKANQWVSSKPPKLGYAALAGAPPPVPHSLQLRTNCLSCHFGPATVKEIKTPHPERTNCLQCHVRRQEQRNFTRKLYGP